jgi:hypothetical protein
MFRELVPASTVGKASLEMSEKNYQILGHELTGFYVDMLAWLAKQEEGNRDYTLYPGQQYVRYDHIDLKVMYPVTQHLGIAQVPDVATQVHQGCDLAVEYFLGDWWQGNEHDEPELNKNHPQRELRWFKVFKRGLFLGGLAGRWDAVAKMCSWFDATIEPEYMAGQLEDEYMLLFLCIAASLRPEPMEGAERLLAKVKACRLKRPRLLCTAWEAAQAGDQRTFDKALKESVDRYLATYDGSGNINHWIALDQSTIWLIAEKNGLAFPSLPPKLAAAVVTRQSAGLAT